MKTIETTVTIGEDHILSVQLPYSIPAGNTDIIIIIDEKAQEPTNIHPPKKIFPEFQAVPLKGNGTAASEMILKDRQDRDSKVSGMQ